MYRRLPWGGIDEPDIVDAADLAGSDFVACGVQGALKGFALGVLLGFLGIAGCGVAFEELCFDEVEFEGSDGWAVRERFDFLAAVDEQVHDAAAEEFDAFAAPPVIFFLCCLDCGVVVPVDDEGCFHSAGLWIEAHVDDSSFEREFLAGWSGAAFTYGEGGIGDFPGIATFAEASYDYFCVDFLY